MDKTGVFGSMFVFLLICVTSETTRTHRPVHTPCNTLTSCDTCLASASCLWCLTNKVCLEYPVTYVIPPASVCKLSQARWALCWLNFEVLIIGISVVCGALLLAITVCCCCCCFKCRRSRSVAHEDEQFSRRREEIRKRAAKRRAERKKKRDEICRKYGLIPDSDHPYSMFENK